MTDINVEEFFKDSAKILATLYQTFPRRHTLFVENFCGAEEPGEFGMHSDRHMSCLGTLMWLGEEGYLRYEQTIRTEALDQAILTDRCFTLLSAPCFDLGEPTTTLPPSEQLEQATHIYRIRMALDERSSTSVRAAISELMLHMAALQPVARFSHSSG